MVKESVIVLQIMEQNTRRLLKVRGRPRHAFFLSHSTCPAPPQAGLLLQSCHSVILNTTPVNH